MLATPYRHPQIIFRARKARLAIIRGQSSKWRLARTILLQPSERSRMMSKLRLRRFASRRFRSPKQSSRGNRSSRRMQIRLKVPAMKCASSLRRSMILLRPLHRRGLNIVPVSRTWIAHSETPSIKSPMPPETTLRTSTNGLVRSTRLWAMVWHSSPVPSNR